MLISIVILVFSFILDGVLTNFLPYGVNNLSFFTPLITMVVLVIIYDLFYHNEKKYLILCFITGLIYDLFYTNLLFFNGFLFLLMGFIVIKLYKMIGFSYLRILLHLLIVIIMYEVCFSLIIIIFNLVPMSIDRLIYKIEHTLLLNLIYGEVIYFIINVIPNKYKKIRIN